MFHLRTREEKRKESGCDPEEEKRGGTWKLFKKSEKKKGREGTHVVKPPASRERASAFQKRAGRTKKREKEKKKAGLHH